MKEIRLSEEELIKNRSISSCIGSGLRLFFGNFKAVFRHLWLKTVIFGCIIGIGLASVLMLQHAHLSVGYVLGGGLIVLIIAVLCVALYFGFAMQQLNGLPIKTNLGKSVHVGLTGIALCVAMTGLIALTDVAIIMPVTAKAHLQDIIGLMVLTDVILALVFCIFQLPFFYSGMKYMVEKDGKYKTDFIKGYKKGFKHMGFLFGLCFLAGLIWTIINTVISIPLSVLSVSKMISDAGLAGGDPSGMPSYYGILVVITSMLTYVLMLFASIWLLYTAYYAYGSIEKKAQDKIRAKSIQAE